jgi:peptidylprolyl isomerase
MHALLAWSALALLSATLAPQAQRKWKPLFDYTNLPPSNAELWAPLGAATVTLEQALKAADEAEEAPIHPFKASLETRGGTTLWHIELFTGEKDAERPGRLNLQVSTSEPKVVKRLELLTLAPDEERAWDVFRGTSMPMDAAIELASTKVVGQKGDKVIVPEPRVRLATFVPELNAPIWDIEVMGVEQKNGEMRRYGVQVNAERPVAKQKVLLDRFVGEPLRAAEPVELPNGMLMHDFIVGEGPEVSADTKVSVNYRLFLLDTTKIHDTWETQQTETFRVSEAPLQGMREGLVGMRAGGKRKLAIPYPLAFGEAGNEVAPRKAMVVCDVQIEKIEE